MIRYLAALIVVLGTFTVDVEVSYAGEAIPRAPRIRLTGGNNGLRARLARSSTAATKNLNKMRNRPERTSLKDTSPYEYRITQQANAQTLYEQKLAKWESKVAKMEENRAKKARQEEERAIEKEMKRREREKKEMAKLQRQQEQRSKTKGGGIFSSRERENDEEGEAGASSARKRHAEEYLNDNSESNGDREEAETENGSAQKSRPSFWQRLRRAVFGGE